VSVHPDELTGNEQAVLLVLMAECRPVPNARLKDLGPALTPEQRKKLLRKRLIEVSGKPMVISLTDDGWAWCRAIIGSDPPAGVTGQKKTLYTVLKALDRYLSHADLAPADVIRPADAAQPAPTRGAAPEPAAAGADIETRVRDVYARLASRPGGWVALTRLREHLVDVPRDDLDVALRTLLRARGISLIPEENQKVLTDADDAAAILIGGERNHLMAIPS
jgi:hypothetical protein